jgi:hypothetical protein
LVTAGRKPEWLHSDNSPEFVASQVQGWLKGSGVGSAHITPGSPWESGYVESFHASLRAEFLNRELFFNMREVWLMPDRRHHYNHERPHGNLSNKPPVPKSTIASSPEKKKTKPQNSHWELSSYRSLITIPCVPASQSRVTTHSTLDSSPMINYLFLAASVCELSLASSGR